MPSQITVTGTISDASGTNLTPTNSATYVRFILRNFSGFCPLVSGTSIVAETQVDIVPDGSGNFSQALWANSALTPQNTFYTVQFFSKGRITSQGNWLFNANTNLNTAAQLNAPSVPAGFSLVLENNGVLNSSQSTLNLVNTDGTIVMTDLGSGNLQVNAAGSTFGTSGVGGFWSAGFPMMAPYGLAVTNGTVSTTIDQITVFQFTLSSPWTVRTVACNVVGSAAGGSFNFGIYSTAGNKLVDSGSLSGVSANVIVSNTITPVTLPAGSYYFAVSAHATASTVTAYSLNSTVLESVLNNSGTVKVGQAANKTATGVMPATLGTITTDGLNINMPAVFFGV